MNNHQQFKALILDFDGVIVDSERYWRTVEDEAIGAVLPNWKPGDYKQVVGISVMDTYDILVERYGLQMEFDAFMDYADMMAAKVYEQCNLFDGMEELMQQAKELGMKLAVATSSRRSWVEPALDRFGIKENFDVIVTAEDLPEGRGKPNPDIYLEAAKQIEVNPGECIVIEDSTNGITSAKSAGMYCIGFRNGIHDELDLSKADTKVISLQEIDLTM